MVCLPGTYVLPLESYACARKKNEEESLFPIAICATHKGGPSSHTDSHCLHPSLVAFQKFLLLYISIETVPLPRPFLHIESASHCAFLKLIYMVHILVQLITIILGCNLRTTAD